MKNIFLILLLFIFSFVSAQDFEIIKLNKSIKDKRDLIKSLIVIDNRADKNIGTISDEKKSITLKFENEDLKNYIETWFANNNKSTGNTDIVLMIEDVKTYTEEDPTYALPNAKLRIKISSFLKRNDKYYFINRFDNVAVNFEKKSASVQHYFADQIENIFTNFIKASYTNSVSNIAIPETEINNYNNYLLKNNNALNNTELKDGVYKNYKDFANQNPDLDFTIEKNKKGIPKRLMYNNEKISFYTIYGYVENGKAYKYTPVGFKEMKKNTNGFYINSSRNNIFFKKDNTGMLVGAMAGGIAGALIGAAIDSSSNNSVGMEPFGLTNNIFSNVYLDSLTGAYIFTK